MRRAACLYIDVVSSSFGVAVVAAVAMGAAPSAGAYARIAPWLAFAAIAEGLVVVQQRRDGAGHMSFSATAHVAVALLFGPFTAAVVAALGVVIVDVGRRQRLRHVAINASTFGVSIGVAGVLFQALGGLRDGQLLVGLSLAMLVLARFAMNTVLYSGVVSAASGAPFLRLFLNELRTSAAAGLGEGCLGVLIGLAALDGRWYALPFLLPLLGGLYAARSNYEQLRSETQAVLRTFVEVIDQRDPNTARHSERVTEYVDRFCRYVGVSDAQQERLVEAARYHDLGKIVVDVATLSKSGRLDAAELDAIRSHARISARLLEPFHFAKEMARYVELHHERFDGQGYYGVAGVDIPIEAHVLIAADSFDAMTSARAYRPALTHAEAAEELRDKAGTQFHPSVGRCFAAMIDGTPIAEAITTDEVATLRRAFATPQRSGWLRVRMSLRRRSLLVAAIVASAITVSAPTLRAPAAAVAGMAAAVYALRRSDRRHDATRLEAARRTPPGEDTAQRIDASSTASTTVVVELTAFEQLRTTAGQLTAERVIGDVERRLRNALHDAAVVGRQGDDAFTITLNQGQALAALAESVERVVSQTRLPARAERLRPRITPPIPGS
jgi:hypothetical protein